MMRCELKACHDGTSTDPAFLAPLTVFCQMCFRNERTNGEGEWNSIRGFQLFKRSSLLNAAFTLKIGRVISMICNSNYYQLSNEMETHDYM
jgi:hypothetical protein